MGRVVFYIDTNSYCAAIECLYNPGMRGLPVAVCGDPTARHRIVLTKNRVVKKCGITTGSAIWEVKAKCPQLVVVQPDYDLYLRFTRQMRDLFSEYSDRVEPFGLDEAWLDMSDPKLTVAGTRGQAEAIRERIKREMGITVYILTTEANDSMRPFHSRMPVYLGRNERDLWVSDNRFTDEALRRQQPALQPTMVEKRAVLGQISLF